MLRLPQDLRRPEGFGSVTGRVLRSTDGVIPSGAPFITWLPAGGPNGTLVLSGESQDDLFVDTENGAANAWTRMLSNVAGGYSRGMLPRSDGHSLMVLSGGRARSTGVNPVTTTTRLVSDTRWKHTVHPGYSNNTSGTQVNFRLPESYIFYDARAAAVVSGWRSPGFNDSGWTAPTDYGATGAAPWNALVERPIPRSATPV